MSVLLLWLMGLSAWSAVAASRVTVTEQQIKAAFLYKFGGYVEWPDAAFASAGSPLEIGLIGAESLADELSRISTNRTVNGRPVVIRRLGQHDQVTGVHVLFLARDQRWRLPEIQAAIRGMPVLLITEGEPLPDGAMINFVVVDDKVRFDIALPSAEAARLRISARLLSVARRVIGRPS